MLTKIAIMFAAWTFILTLVNPFFENRRLRNITIVTAVAGSVAWVLS